MFTWSLRQQVESNKTPRFLGGSILGAMGESPIPLHFLWTQLNIHHRKWSLCQCPWHTQHRCLYQTSEAHKAPVQVIFMQVFPGTSCMKLLGEGFQAWDETEGGFRQKPWRTPTFTLNTSPRLQPKYTLLLAFSYKLCMSSTSHSSMPSLRRAHQMTCHVTWWNAFSRWTKAMYSVLLNEYIKDGKYCFPITILVLRC